MHLVQGQREKERHLRELSLSCLVKVLSCLVGWYESMQRGEEEASTSRELGLSAENGDESLTGSSSTALLQQFEQRKQQKSIIEHGIDL